MKLNHTLASHDDANDTQQIEVVLDTYQIDINLPGDVGKTLNGAEVMDGYSRTVRIEVRQNVLKVLVYPTQCDEPVTLDLTFEDFKPKIEE